MQWNRLHGEVSLQHHGGPEDTVNEWLLTKDGKRYSGQLVSRGYRSAALLVLAIQPEDARWPVRLPVWSDSVSPEQFSYLNLQLMFNCKRG